MLELQSALSLLVEFFKRNNHCLAVYLFGSYADGTAHPKSDLDLAVLFNDELDLWREMALEAQLSQLLHFEEVDLVNLNKAPLRLQFTIIATGQLIYEANFDRTSDFLEKTLIRYHDREYHYKVFFKEWDEGLKEDYRG